MTSFSASTNSCRLILFKGKSGSSDVLPMVTIYPLLYAIDIPLIDIMFSISFELLDHPSRMQMNLIPLEMNLKLIVFPGCKLSVLKVNVGIFILLKKNANLMT
jgi:hypothetical protein